MIAHEHVEISASLLSAPRTRLVEIAEALVKGGVQRLHWDVFDGAFAAGDGFDVADAAHVHARIEVSSEAHIMAKDATALALEWSEICDRVVVHLEQDDGPGPSIEAVRGGWATAAVAINPDTPLAALTPWLHQVPDVLVMSRHPGLTGAPFRPATTQRLSALRSAHPTVRLGVDGGVTRAAAHDAILAGASWIISGTDLLSARDPGRWVQAVTGSATARVRRPRPSTDR
jgi:ribulose-phosphate 3-epimerase